MSPSPNTPKKTLHVGADSHNQPIADPLAHFLALPWAAKLLHDPAATNITVSDRTPLASRDKRFVREVLNTHDTVRACVTWLRPVVAKTDGDNMGDMRPISKSAGLLSGGGRENGEEECERPFLLFNVLLDLGEGLCGFRGTMHGGAVGPVLDEVMCAAADSQSNYAVTATMSFTYLRPIKLPGVVLVRSRVVKKEGRKIHVRGTIEDGDGNVLVESEALLIDKNKKDGKPVPVEAKCKL